MHLSPVMIHENDLWSLFNQLS